MVLFEVLDAAGVRVCGGSRLRSLSQTSTRERPSSILFSDEWCFCTHSTARNRRLRSPQSVPRPIEDSHFQHRSWLCLQLSIHIQYDPWPGVRKAIAPPIVGVSGVQWCDSPRDFAAVPEPGFALNLIQCSNRASRWIWSRFEFFVKVERALIRWICCTARLNWTQNYIFQTVPVYLHTPIFDVITFKHVIWRYLMHAACPKHLSPRFSDEFGGVVPCPSRNVSPSQNTVPRFWPEGSLSNCWVT